MRWCLDENRRSWSKPQRNKNRNAPKTHTNKKTNDNTTKNKYLLSDVKYRLLPAIFDDRHGLERAQGRRHKHNSISAALRDSDTIADINYLVVPPWRIHRAAA